MNIGDYVRFNDRDWTEIGQITGYVEDSHLKVVKCRDGYYELDNFIKYGSIIDVIEVGDYVNGAEVVGFEKDNDNKEYLEYGVGNYVVGTYYEESIKSIVTKEAFESMEYRIGE